MESGFDAWADIYDSIYSYVRDDIPFYVSAARESGGRVLELGCGTGRVTLPIAEAGVDVVGLESSEAMLEVARRKAGRLPPGTGAPTLVLGDMTDMPMGPDEQFSLVIVPFRGFLSLLTVEEQEKTLLGVKRRLSSGGRLIVSIFVPDLDMLVQEGDAAYHFRDVTDPETGERFVLWHQSRYDNHNQMIFGRLIVDRLDEDGAVTNRLYRDFHLRYVHRWEMHHLLVSCGYEVVDLLGDFQSSPFDETSTEMIWVAATLEDTRRREVAR